MRNLLNNKLYDLTHLQDGLIMIQNNITENKDMVDAIEQAQEIMQKAAKISQQQLAKHLSGIVTQAIQAVVQKPYGFVCEFVERRGATECDLYLMKGGDRFEILSGTGGGLADVISFSLKVAYLLLSSVDRVLIIDEVSRHINSKQQREYFATVLVRLSKEFDIQLILNTTIPELLAVADKVIVLKQVNDITEVVDG